MTYLVYLDEQEGKIGEENFTAIIGCRVAVSDINVVRAKFYPLFNDIINKANKIDESISGRFIGPIPVLHGSDFLRDYNDEVKIETLNLLSDCLEGMEIEFLRIGYFNRSIPSGILSGTRQEMLTLSLMGISFAIDNRPDANHIFISEIDKMALNKSLESNFNNASREFATGSASISYNLMRTIGHFYVPKSDLGCQIADVFNYCCLKSTENNTAFGQLMGDFYLRFANLWLVNQIIWVNDRARNFNLPQINPVDSGTLHHRTSPLQTVFHIIPNDEVLQTVEIPAVK